MKIIKKGVIPENIDVEKTCRNCGTVFSAKKKEFTYVSYPREYAYTISCPVCNILLYFDKV